MLSACCRATWQCSLGWRLSLAMLVATVCCTYKLQAVALVWDKEKEQRRSQWITETSASSSVSSSSFLKQETDNTMSENDKCERRIKISISHDNVLFSSVVLGRPQYRQLPKIVEVEVIKDPMKWKIHLPSFNHVSLCQLFMFPMLIPNICWKNKVFLHQNLVFPLIGKCF